MITLEELKKRLSRNPRFLKEYEQADAEYSLVESLIEARLSADLTQAQVAERMGTTQSAVARLESGMVSPSFTTLRRFAVATGTKIQVNFVPLEVSVEDERANGT